METVTKVIYATADETAPDGIGYLLLDENMSPWIDSKDEYVRVGMVELPVIDRANLVHIGLRNKIDYHKEQIRAIEITKGLLIAG